MDYLHNVIEIDGANYVFLPSGPGILSDIKHEQMLLEAYNSPQDLADREKIFQYESPAYVHENFRPKNNGTLAKEAKDCASHIPSQEE